MSKSEVELTLKGTPRSMATDIACLLFPRLEWIGSDFIDEDYLRDMLEDALKDLICGKQED